MQREPIDWKPRRPRRRTNLVAVVMSSDGVERRVLVSDLTYDGCQILGGHELMVGEAATLRMAGKGAIEAQVRWTDGDKAGLKFLVEGSALEQRRLRLGV
jgi:hypothetical protein